MHFSIPTFAITAILAAVPSYGADVFMRDICICRGNSGDVGYNLAFSYYNGRLNQWFNAHERCVGRVANPPQCSLDAKYFPGVRVCDEARQFCYNFEIFGRDKYSLDGNEATVPQNPDPTGFTCDQICDSIVPGMKGDIGSKNEAYYNIEPGL